MTAGPRPGPTLRNPIAIKIVVLVLAPLLVAAGFAVGFYGGWLAPPDASGVEARGQRLASWFEGQMVEARAITVDALIADPTGAPKRRAASPIGSRLEGVGLQDRERHYLSWQGVPPDSPLRSFDQEEEPSWTVRLDGVRTRLVVRAGPDDRGHTAVSSFIIDSLVEEQAFERLLPSSLTDGVQLQLEFLDTHASERILDPSSRKMTAEGDEGAGSERVALRSPEGKLLALASIHGVDRAHAASRVRGSALAWSVVTLLVLVLVLFRWDRLTLNGRGLAWVVLSVLVGRGLLLAARVPSRILPREFGSASFFGTSALGGLAASPADLALTALAVYALCVALRNFAARLSAKRPRMAQAITVAGALAAVVASTWMLLGIARDSSVPLFAPLAVGWLGVRTLLAAGLGLALLGAAELLALAWRLARRRRPIEERRGTRVSVGVVLSIALLGASLVLQQMSQRLALERLGSEYAPQVLEQSARRSVALSAAVQRVAQSFQAAGGSAVPVSSQPDFLAYYFWVTGELFFSGYKSSLSFYNTAGELVSHFGFEVPALDEVPESPADDAGVVRSWEEDFESGYVERKLYHAELPVFGNGTMLGTVVGHVIDEPDNLPFLPRTHRYLAALGPGAPYGAVNLPFGQPHYVLFDASGTVLISTLSQPPAMADALVQVFERGGEVRVRSGADRYVGFGEQDKFHRLHLLLIPSPGLLQRLAASVRLFLVGVVLLMLVSVIPKAARGRTVLDAVRSVQGSFYRKLLVALLVASIVPLIGLGLFMRGYTQQRGRETLEQSATQFAGAAQRVLDDYAASQVDANADAEDLFNDNIVDWLRTVVGQEIMVYENGSLRATSKRELFTSGLLLERLDGEVHRRLGREGLPYLVVRSRLGPTSVPVAYAPLQGTDPLRELVVAVPMIVQQQEIEQATGRVGEMILLSTVLLGALLAVVAAVVARTVARPVRELVGATARIAAGDYATRLDTQTRDEVADLVRGFNSMASSLATQRADLERRRDYIERLLQHATTGVISTDPAGRIVTFNPAARELLTTRQGRPAIGEELVASVGRFQELEPLATLLSRPPRDPGEPEEVDLERDGEPRRMRLVRIDLPDPAGGSVGRLILLDDVTELMRANRLAAWAEMARAIAHEIKNPLTPIQLSTEHLKRLLRDRRVLPEPTIEACLDTVIKQVRTLYDIAGEFSAYAKLPTLRPEPSDPVAFMRSAIGPYRVANPDGVEFEEHYEPVGRVAIDGKVLGRAVVNLIENALQAMPEGGRLSVSVGPDEEANEVVLTVEDTGVGLDPEARKRLFEPYFSTKSSGTGLGLAIARRAVEAHHGRIEVETDPGRGTVFRIHLPRVA